jgi:hypothetical protein
MSVTELLEEALRLPPASRASLVEKIVESLAVDIDPELEKSHLRKVENRRTQAAVNPSEIVPGPEALQRARSILPT